MPNAKKIARYSKKDLREVSDNSEMTKEDFARARPFPEVFPDLAASTRKGAVRKKLYEEARIAAPEPRGD